MPPTYTPPQPSVELPDKKLPYVLGVIVVIILVAGGYYFLHYNKSNTITEGRSTTINQPSNMIVENSGALSIVAADKQLKPLLTFEELTSLFKAESGYQNDRVEVSVAWSPDRKWIVVGYSTLKMDTPSSGYTMVGLGLMSVEGGVATFKIISPLNNDPRPFLGFSPNSKLLAYTTVPKSPVITIIDVATGKVVAAHSTNSADRFGYGSWVDEDTINYVADGIMYLYKISSKKIETLQPKNFQNKKHTKYGDTEYISDLPLWSPDARFVVFEAFNGSGSTLPELWIMDTQTMLATKLSGNNAAVLGFTKDSKVLSFAEADRSTIRVDLPTLIKTEEKIVPPSGYVLQGSKAFIDGTVLSVWSTYPSEKEAMHSVVTNSTTGEIICPNYPISEARAVVIRTFSDKPVLILNQVTQDKKILSSVVDLVSCTKIFEIKFDSPDRSGLYF